MENKENIVDLSKMNIEQLKAFAYDEIIKIENAKNNLIIIQTEINKRIKGE